SDLQKRLFVLLQILIEGIATGIRSFPNSRSEDVTQENSGDLVGFLSPSVGRYEKACRLLSDLGPNTREISDATASSAQELRMPHATSVRRATKHHRASATKPLLRAV